MIVNACIGWIAFLLGGLAGAIPGLFFHHPDWLGGYSSWRRRMIRLAHISFFGLGLINLLFALTAKTLRIETGLQGISALLIVGVIAMPAVCYLSAWKQPFRNLFFIPALSVIAGIALFVWRMMQP